MRDSGEEILSNLVYNLLRVKDMEPGYPCDGASLTAEQEPWIYLTGGLRLVNAINASRTPSQRWSDPRADLRPDHA